MALGSERDHMSLAERASAVCIDLAPARAGPGADMGAPAHAGEPQDLAKSLSQAGVPCKRGSGSGAVNMLGPDSRDREPGL